MTNRTVPVLDQEGLTNYDYLIKQYIDKTVEDNIAGVSDTLSKLVFGGLPDDSVNT